MNVLIVGNGSIGTRHRAVVEACESVETVTSVGQRDFDRALNGKTHDELEEYILGLTGIKPDFAIIAGPASTHIKTAAVFADMNVNMIIEKPLSNNLEGVTSLLRLIDTKDLCVSVGYNLRFLPSLQHFKKVVDDGQLGKLHSVRCEVGQYLPDWRPDADYTHSVSANSSLGGGVLLELSHEIDYLQWIFGPIQSVSGSAYNSGRLDIDVEDTAHLLFSFRNKPADQPLMGSVDMDFIRRDPTRACVAIGELGTLRWDGIVDEVSLYDPEQGQWGLIHKGSSSRDDSYKQSLQHFIDCIDNKSSPQVSAIDGLSVLNVIAAIRKSSESHRLVDVNL